MKPRSGLLPCGGRSFSSTGIAPGHTARNSQRLRLLAATAAIGGSICVSGSIPAATTNSALAVSANVVATCTLTAAPVAFASLSPSATTSSISTVTVNCTQGNALTIELDGGTNAVSGQRRLASGGNYINYHLYQPTAAGNAPSSPAVAWGNGGVSATGSAFTSTCNGNAQLFNVYAQVPAGQTLFAGTYTDAVMVTVTY